MYILYNAKEQIIAISDYLLEMLGVNSLGEFKQEIGDISNVFTKCDPMLNKAKVHYTKTLKYGAIKDKKVFIKTLHKNMAYELKVKELVALEEMYIIVEFHKVDEVDEFNKAILLKSTQIGVDKNEYKLFLQDLVKEYQSFLKSDFTKPHTLTNTATYLKLEKIVPLLQKINKEIGLENIENAKEFAKAVGDYFNTLQNLIKATK